MSYLLTVEKNCCQESMGDKCRLYRLKTNSGKKLLSGKHGSQVWPLPLPKKKIVLRKAWVTSVTLTFTKKNCSQESMGHDCSLHLYRLKMDSAKDCSHKSMCVSLDGL